jgi:hypothetical protein
MIRVRVYEGGTLDEGVDVCLEARLYVASWALRPSLTNADPTKDRLAVCFKDKEPVALAFITDWSPWRQSELERPTLMAFCKDSERRNGYASRCVRALGDRPAGIVSYIGLEGSEKFWKRNGLTALET